MNTSAPANDRADLALRNVTLIVGDGTPAQSGQTVLVKNGRIASIVDNADALAATREIDGSGRFLMPGLIDAHCHPSGAAPGHHDLATIFEPMVRFGVTGAVVYGGSRGSYASMEDLAQRSASGDLNAPRIFYSSPIVTIEGAHPIRTYTANNWVEGSTILIPRSLTDIDAIVADAAQHDVIGVKITVEDGPAPPFIDPMPTEWIERFVAAGQRHDVPIYAHISDMHEVRACVAAGVHALVHFWGAEIDWERDAATIARMVELDISWVTTMMIGKALVYYPQHREWLDSELIREVYDPALLEALRSFGSADEARGLLAEWTGDPDYPFDDYFTEDVANLAEAYRRGVNVVLGTDMGNDFILPGYALHEEMQILQAGGLPALDILRMGTHNAAKMIGRLDDLGTLEVGKLADMTLLGADPTVDIANALTIDRVFIGGVERVQVAATERNHAEPSR